MEASLGTSGETDAAFAPNTEEWVYYTFDYGFVGEVPPSEPTLTEIEDLVCKTNAFLSDTLRRKTADDSVQSEAMYIEWTYNPDANFPVSLSFGLNATTDGGQLAEDTVYDNTQLSMEEILEYITGYVSATDSESIFQQVNSVNFTSTGNTPIPVGSIEKVECSETPAPTSMPTLLTEPSSPTASGNNTCVNAIVIQAGDTIAGTTESGGADGVEVCDIGIEVVRPAAEDGISLEPLSMWYSIEATDSRLRASVCSETTNPLAPLVVTIYAGGDDCFNLTCASVYNTAGCSVEWEATSDFELYYILVTSLVVEGTPLDLPEDLSFELQITEPQPPTNDACEGAIELEPGDIIASRTRSASEKEIADGVCTLELQPPNTNVLVPAVWFSIIGDGGPLVASTCSEDTDGGPILVTIYSGACDSLQCETNEVANEPCSAEISSTVVGETYYIMIEKPLRGDEEGVFELTL